MKNTHSTFETFLTQQDSRYTSQKQAIVEEIGKIRQHFEVEEFIDKLRKNDTQFSRATVYRTLKQLFDAGLIQKITTKDGKVFYEHNFLRKHHDHIICNICGSISELNETIIDKVIDDYCQKTGFSLEYRSMHIYGKCQKCRDSELSNK